MTRWRHSHLLLGVLFLVAFVKTRFIECHELADDRLGLFEALVLRLMRRSV